MPIAREDAETRRMQEGWEARRDVGRTRRREDAKSAGGPGGVKKCLLHAKTQRREEMRVAREDAENAETTESAENAENAQECALPQRRKGRQECKISRHREQMTVV